MKRLRLPRSRAIVLVSGSCVAACFGASNAAAQELQPSEEPQPAQAEQAQQPAQQQPPAPSVQREGSLAPPPTVALDPGVRLPPASDLSPQNFAFELRFGRYLPKVDEGVESPIFEDFFGDTNRYMLGFEVDWQLWRTPYVGTLGVGAGWGYTAMTGPNHPPPESAQPEDQPIAQNSRLSIMPMHAVGVLRVDVLAKQLDVPLVPYGKLGLGYALWWVNDGVGTARNAEGTAGKDHSFGTHAALGGMLLLDMFDPVAARSMDAEAGINNSYLFFEWVWSDFDGSQMNVGTSTWFTGLAIEL
jgi:hypothetical protein